MSLERILRHERKNRNKIKGQLSSFGVYLIRIDSVSYIICLVCTTPCSSGVVLRPTFTVVVLFINLLFL